MVLVGKSGAGKSTSGNLILGKTVFPVGHFANSGTMCSAKECAERDRIAISVIDTPGLFSTSMDDEEVKRELKRCISLSDPGPHVFLLVVRLGRFTQEDRSAVLWFQRQFGEEASQYTMVLFTGADQIKVTLNEFVNNSKDCQDLIGQYGGRYHVLGSDDKQNLAQVPELMQKIEEMVTKNGGKYYTNEMYKEAEKRIQDEEERRRREEEEEKRQEEEKRRTDGTWANAKLVLAAVAGTVFGIVARR